MKTKMIRYTVFTLVVSLASAMDAAAAKRPGLLGALDRSEGALAEVLSLQTDVLNAELGKPLSDLADHLRATRSIVAETSRGAPLLLKQGREINVPVHAAQN